MEVVRKAGLDRPKLLAVAVSVSLASLSYAANAEEQAVRLPSIDVVGQEGTDIARQPGSVTIVNKEQLEMLQPRSTEEALRGVPGIVIKPEEESAVVTNIGMRGLSAGDYKTLTLEDGVPVAPGLFVGNGRYYNPRVQHMESIEVLKGASSLRYGPSTIGGVINYITKQPKDGAALSLRTGSWNTHEAMLEVGGSSPSKEAVFGAVLTRVESDGFMDKGYDMTDIMLKAGLAIGDDQWLGIKYGHYENDANISYRGLFLQDYKDGKKYNPAPDDYFLTERHSIDLNHEWDINEDVRLNTLVYWNDMSRDYWRYDADGTASGAAGRWVYKDTLGGRNRTFERLGVESRLFVNHNTFGLNNEAEIGLRYMTEEMHNQRVRDNTASNPYTITTLSSDVIDSADSLAFYVQNRFMLTDSLAVTPGVRVEYYEQERKDLQDTAKKIDSSNTEVLPGIGATWQFAPSTQMFGGIYKAFAPALNGDALDGYQDQKLDAERSINIEIGVRGEATEKVKYEVAAFRMDFDNQIIPANSNTDFQKTNGGKTLHQGLEAAVALDLGAGFSLDANATWVKDAEFKGNRYAADGVTVTTPDGNRVTYAPEWVGNVSLGYKVADLKTSLSASYIDSQYTDVENTNAIAENTSGFFTGKIDAYTVFNLNAYYQVNESLSVSGAVKNLADKRYISSLRQGIYVGPERSFDVGVRYQF